MLTADLIRPRLRQYGTELQVETIAENDVHWLKTATDLLTLFEQCHRQPRATWDKLLEEYVNERLDYVVVRGIAKVLTDAATFTQINLPLSPTQIREHLFTRGPVFQTPQIFQPQTRLDVLTELATELTIPLKELEFALFADRPSAYILENTESTHWTAEKLLARYNLELTRGVLYWASNIQIEVHGGYKDLWKYLKFFKLMYWIQAQQQQGYTIDLDGPISPFVNSTLRYGRQFAAFLPALLLCDEWRMSASVITPHTQRSAIFKLDHTSTLRSHFKKSGEFDSQLEANFAQEFEEKFGTKRGKWELSREDEVLVLDDTVMIPDFALTHKQTGRRILIELVGFWHPDYLKRKVEKVRVAQCENLLLLVYEGVNLAPERWKEHPGEVLYFKQKPVMKEVMATVEKLAERVYGPIEQLSKKIKKPSIRRKKRQDKGGNED